MMMNGYRRGWLGVAVGLILAVPGRGTAGDDTLPSLPPAFDNGPTGAPAEDPYWEQFNDPVLSELVKRGLRGNFDIQTAKERIVQAEAVARQTLAPLLPSVSAEAAWSMRPFDTVSMGMTTSVPPTTGASADLPETMQTLTTLLKASYLVDITGKSYVTRQAALLDAAASEADAETQAANLVSLIVQTYFDAVTAKLRLLMVEEQIRNSEELLKLVETRFKTGASNALDVLQQRQQLEAARAQLPLVRAIIDTSRQQLAALVGAGSVKELPEIQPALPELTDAHPLGTPKRLLNARPDLRAAAKRVDASERRERSAVRALLPTLALNGQVGYQMRYLDEVDNRETWSLGVVLSVPLYMGGVNWAALDQARAAKRGASSTLQQSALNAMRQVESAVINERERRERLRTLVAQQEAAKLTLGEARKRYLVGLTDYLNVLASLGTYQGVQLSVLQAEQDVITARIQLLSALGGDWTRTLLSGDGAQP